MNIHPSTTVTLNNGINLPLLGFGVWSAAPGESTQNAVSCALNSGYRHIDTAQCYDNEEDVGIAVNNWKQNNVNQDVFITTKLRPDAAGYEQTQAAFHASLEKLQTECIDLYLMHWPLPEYRQANYQAMQDLYHSGKCKAIGVSNFTIKHLQELATYASVVPVVNQVEYNVFLYQQELKAYCASNNIQLCAYSPLARMQLDEPNSVLVDIAKKHAKSVAQICVRWILEQGIPTFPKSVNSERIKQNFEVFDFALDANDKQRLDALNRNYRCNPDWNPELID